MTYIYIIVHTHTYKWDDGFLLSRICCPSSSRSLAASVAMLCLYVAVIYISVGMFKCFLVSLFLSHICINIGCSRKGKFWILFH